MTVIAAMVAAVVSAAAQFAVVVPKNADQTQQQWRHGLIIMILTCICRIRSPIVGLGKLIA